MKTKEECKNEIAKNHNFSSWHDLHQWYVKHQQESSLIKQISEFENKILECENEAMDLYADQIKSMPDDAVEFSEWREKNEYAIDQREQHSHTHEELYKIFKEEKLKQK